jgi:predicted O-methyltransferase YrrM
MHLNLSTCLFNHDWFSNSEIKARALTFVDRRLPHNILEIGCFEGLSSRAFADNFLDHPDSTLDLVDPWDISDTTTPLDTQTEDHFIHNISQSPNFNKVSIHKQYSTQFFESNTKTFDFIYIDGSHLPNDVYHDMEHAHAVLRKNGIMWMDDFLSSAEVQKVMHDFLLRHSNEYELIHQGWQLAIKKQV